METFIVEDHWYSDSLPGGFWFAVKFDANFKGRSISTWFGKLTPPDDLLYLAVNDKDNRNIVGVGHDTDNAYEYKDNAWQDRSHVEGARPGIYDANGNLVLIRETEGAPTGSQGWRYVDDEGNLVSADDTIKPDSPVGLEHGIKNLWQYTIHDGIAIGELQNGVGAFVNGKTVELHKELGLGPETQSARNVKFHKQGNDLSICWYYFLSATKYFACFAWLTVDELLEMVPEGGEVEPIPEPTSEVMIKAFERPLWQAPYFSHHVRYGDTPKEQHVGNAIAVLGDERDDTVRDEELDRIKELGMPMIVDIGVKEPPFHDNIVIWLAAGFDIDHLGENVRRALDYRELPVIAYLDSRDWPTEKPDWMTDRVWPSIQAYRNGNESLDDFKNEMDDVIHRVSNYDQPMCLVSRFDDFNGTSTIQKTLECVPYYEYWVREYNFVAHMPFADRRGNGIAKNPPLHAHAKSFQYAIPFERPNRFDYFGWNEVPEGKSIQQVWDNKRKQTRASIVLEPYFREYIDSTFENGGNGEPPPVDENGEEKVLDTDLLFEITKSTWDKHSDHSLENKGNILNEIAWRYNDIVEDVAAGLSHKPGGTNTEMPNGTKVASDIIQAKPAEGEVFSKMYDVFTDAGPVYPIEAHPHNQEDRTWVEPVEP